MTHLLLSKPQFLADSFSDPENARIIYLVAGGLVVMAVGLTVGTVWWWRSSKSEHPALGPLEVMGTRRWWRSDYNERARRLAEARPEPADDAAADERAPEPVDLQSLVLATHDGYDDLLDDDVRAAKQAEQAAAAAAEAAAEEVAMQPESPPLAPPRGTVSLADLAASSHMVEGVRDRTPSGGAPIDPLLRITSADE